MELSFDSIDSTTLTKLELADFLFEKIGFNKREAREFIDAFFENIIKELAEGRNVKISGFGNFETRDKPSRPGRNPRTGQAVLIPQKRVLIFKASGKLKNLISKG
jgi:integration host factor subunit alpha